MATAMQVLCIIIVIAYSTPYFMLAVLPMGLVYYYIQKYYGKMMSTTCVCIYAYVCVCVLIFIVFPGRGHEVRKVFFDFFLF